MRNRCPWLDYQVQVTKYHVDEQYPSGDYSNQASGEKDNLRTWINKDESIVDENMVLWHYTGATHVCRLEEFPIMVRHIVKAFKIQPNGFFDENPCLDVPTNQEKPTSGTSCCFIRGSH